MCNKESKLNLRILQLSILLITALFFFSAIPAIAVQKKSFVTMSVDKNKTDRIIVKYKNSASENQMGKMSDTAVTRLSARAGVSLRHKRKLATGAHLFSMDMKRDKDELDRIINYLMADDNVEYAEPDLIMRPMATTPNDSRYSDQWHYFESTGGLNLPDAWDIAQGDGVVVAVIDTGILSHTDLNANILPGYDMISNTDVARDGDGRDSDPSDPGDWAPANECYSGYNASNSSWHGTHVAGTIAAVTNNGTGVAGVAYDAKVVPVRVLGRCGGYMSDIADGIIWASGGSVSGVPSNSNPAQVLNLSLGGPGNCGNTTQNAINTARSNGATVVVAAGNSNTNASNTTPANCSGVITIASVDRTGGRAYYSNYGSVVDVAAPGGDTSVSSNGVLSTLNSGTHDPYSQSYAYYQGTSMATPHVAGVVALMYDVDPQITPDEVEAILKRTSRSFPDTCSQCGSGIVDAYAALDEVNGGGSELQKLQNGVPVTGLSASKGSDLHYTMDVPSDATNLIFETSGGFGDADLYVRYGSAPTTTSYDCRPYNNGNAETCNMSTQAGTYYVMVRAYQNFSSVSLEGSYSQGGGGGFKGLNKTNISGLHDSVTDYSVEVPTGKTSLDVTMSGGSGDGDLYVRFGSNPTFSKYDCRPYKNGNNESCSFSNPSAGTWYIRIYGYFAFSGVTLKAK
ncbi:MAG: S8 family serine peptidase [Planctomycetes bacterium]|nr:S8 family serine peptidase [Planctomycetota bacterium]